MTGLLGFQSAWTDAASGKDLMGARWYNPGDGDFTSADTVSVSPDPDPAAGNPFAYAADEPLDLVDPTGHYIVPPGGPDGAGTSERVGNGVTSPNNWIADVATARVVEHAVITAPQQRCPCGGRPCGGREGRGRERESLGWENQTSPVLTEVDHI
jgi:RHS repeat-associated protein